MTAAMDDRCDVCGHIASCVGTCKCDVDDDRELLTRRISDIETQLREIAPFVESWKPVVGYEGLYEVSSRGRVRSLRRTVEDTQGRRKTIPGRVLSMAPRPSGHLHITLHKDGVQVTQDVHDIVLEAFDGVRPGPGAVCRHRDGDPANNAIENLTWGTQLDNMRDMVRHGSIKVSQTTHCKRGHLLMAPNLDASGILADPPSRSCRACHQGREHARRYGTSVKEAADQKLAEILAEFPHDEDLQWIR